MTEGHQAAGKDAQQQHRQAIGGQTEPQVEL